MPHKPGVTTAKLKMPRTLDDLRDWIRQNLRLDLQAELDLVEAIEEVLTAQRQLVEESKRDAIQALTEGFASKMEKLQGQLSEKDTTVSNNWFMERVESFLAVEQRVRWCGVGVVDITSFKRYNDTLGHAVGDCIIERVAAILSDQIRSQDFLALERGHETRDLHARFGGDEFCFLIPHLPGCAEATEIAERFKQAVERHDWEREDPRLAAHPVKVDVGVVCLRLGPVAERRGVARQLAADLIQRADILMYEAKSQHSTRVHAAAVAIDDGRLVDVEGTRPA
jgi:diguanylate cyclase (GGDEF)-like protein